MANPLKVSQTKVGLWRKCHAAFHYRYVMKLRKKVKPRPLVFGDIVHQMIETDANGYDAFETLDGIEKAQGKTFRVLEEEYGRIVEDVHDIMVDYFAYWEDTITYISVNDKQAEFTFEVEIDKDIVAIGKIDNIAKTPNKLRWLVEHKTGKNIPNEDHRWRSIQSALYIRVIDILGIKKIQVDGTLWDFIRSKPPGRPQLKKNGELSARNVDTLPERVKRFLQENGLTEKGNKALLAKAEANRSNYFQRAFTPTKKKVIDRLFDDFLFASRDIADRGHKIKDMNIDRHCDWCAFEPLCRAMLRGTDLDFVLKADYVVNEKPEEFEPDFEA